MILSTNFVKEFRNYCIKCRNFGKPLVLQAFLPVVLQISFAFFCIILQKSTLMCIKMERKTDSSISAFLSIFIFTAIDEFC